MTNADVVDNDSSLVCEIFHVAFAKESGPGIDFNPFVEYFMTVLKDSAAKDAKAGTISMLDFNFKMVTGELLQVRSENRRLSGDRNLD